MPVSARGAKAKPSAALAAHAELKAMQQQRMDPRKLISALGAETMAVEDAMNSTELETLVEPMRAAVERRCLLYTSPSPRDRQKSRMPSSA